MFVGLRPLQCSTALLAIMVPSLRTSTRLQHNRSKTSLSSPKHTPESSDQEQPAIKRRKVKSVMPIEATHTESETADDKRDSKWRNWSAHATSSPFPEFKFPTHEQCEAAHRVLTEMHGEDVKAEFEDPDTPETIPHVLDAMVVAILSQATGWSNAKRAMNSMKQTYGSIYAYDDIIAGGMEKLQETLRCGGLHIRKSKIIMSILERVKVRQGVFDLDFLFELNDEEAMKELLSYKGMGPKSAFVVKTWCLKRQGFTVDTHVYRISGFWGWRPEKASVTKTQAHLDAVIPKDLQFDLHFLILQHGRKCPACRGGATGNKKCEAQERMK